MFNNIHTTRTILFIVAALVVVGGIGYYNIKKDSTVAGNTDSSEATTNGDKKDDIAVVNNKTGDSTAVKTDNEEETPDAGDASRVTAIIPIPNLDRPTVFEENYSTEQREKVNGQVKILADALKADPNLFNEWMDLALLLKSVGDYEWAREAWEYASAIRPGNSLSFANLGVLYGYYLKDPVKAEANLLHAIENEPRFLDFYARTADFYLEVVKDKSKALDFLDRSIKKYPEWTELNGLRMYIIK